MAIKFLDDLPYTEAGASLKMNESERDVLRVVYKPSETSPDSYEFYDLWDYKKDYPDDYVAVPVASVLGNSIFCNEGTEFVNIIGSSNDPKPVSGSWIDIMRNNGIENCDSCCAESAIYEPDSQQAIDCDFNCGGNMVGGHVILNTQHSVRVRPGESVYLLPICAKHNLKHFPGYDVGAGYYMKLRRSQNALTLNRYLNRAMIEQMLKNYL